MQARIKQIVKPTIQIHVNCVLGSSMPCIKMTSMIKVTIHARAAVCVKD
jgi:hypothetical protein